VALAEGAPKKGRAGRQPKAGARESKTAARQPKKKAKE
jgi:hypothetical protein